MIVFETVRAAQANDLDAIAQVIEATEERVSGLARKFAARSRSNRAELHEEYSQIGRIAVWESLDRFQGETLDDFFGFVTRTVQGSLRDAAREEMYPGGDEHAMKALFAALRETDGDVYAAEALIQTKPMYRDKLVGADRAYAARLAYQGTDSLYLPPREGDDSSMITLADSVPSTLGIPGELSDVEDQEKHDKALRKAAVWSTLDSMGKGQSAALRFTYGIGAPEYGNNNDRIIEDLGGGVTSKIVNDWRDKGHKSFASRWIKAQISDELEAEEMHLAAAKQRDRTAEARAKAQKKGKAA